MNQGALSGAPAPIGTAMSFAALQQSGLELGLCRKRGRGWPNNLDSR